MGQLEGGEHPGILDDGRPDDRVPLDREDLQGLDPDRVVYLGTASKTLAPALRLAWMVLPGDLVEPVSEAKLLADHHIPTLDQLTLAEFIRSGAYDRHVRARRLAYRRRRDRLVEALPAGRVSGISAGLHALVLLPAPMTEAEAVSAAAAGGLALEGLESYRTGPDIQHRRPSSWATPRRPSTLTAPGSRGWATSSPPGRRRQRDGLLVRCQKAQ